MPLSFLLIVSDWYVIACRVYLEALHAGQSKNNYYPDYASESELETKFAHCAHAVHFNTYTNYLPGFLWYCGALCLVLVITIVSDSKVCQQDSDLDVSRIGALR